MSSDAPAKLPDRLNAAVLPELARRGQALPYQRDNLSAGIVHIGIGAFHRAHMAHYVHRLLGAEPDWAIVGASLRRPDTRQALMPQDYLYSLTVQDGSSTSTEVIGSIIDVIDASHGTQGLIDIMSRASTRIVSLTVTEKGYCHEPRSGRLQVTHPDIMHDLANRRSPRSAPGIIVAALEERRARGLGGFTVLSCDNLQGNGRIIRQAVLDFANLHDASLAGWIDSHASFPGTMVDRIVPATTQADRDRAAQGLGYVDAWPIVCEPFSQWVVEDHFAAGRPALETVGVQLVDEVEPFEMMKLRMLNGSHSAIAYLGLLMGREFVSEVVAEASVHRFLRRQMLEEAAPTLPLPAPEMEAYADRLLERFSNKSLAHRCAQIAMDGSQKLPQRILAPIRERLGRGQGVHLMALTIAAWIAYLEQGASGGEEGLIDPMAEHLLGLVNGVGRNAKDLVRAVLSVEAIAGTDLVQSTILIDAVTGHLTALRRDGPFATVAAAAAR